jgi:hypothetical protein
MKSADTAFKKQGIFLGSHIGTLFFKQLLVWGFQFSTFGGASSVNLIFQNSPSNASVLYRTSDHHRPFPIPIQLSHEPDRPSASAADVPPIRNQSENPASSSAATSLGGILLSHREMEQDRQITDQEALKSRTEKDFERSRWNRVESLRNLTLRSATIERSRLSHALCVRPLKFRPDSGICEGSCAQRKRVTWTQSSGWWASRCK